MGKVNVWVRRSSLVVISVIAIISLMLLGLTLFGHGVLYNEEEMEHSMGGLHFFYGISVAILALAILGGFGVYKEKKWALIVFSVGMILGSLIMIAIGCFGVAFQPQFAHEMKEHYLSLLPLTNISDANADTLDEAQIHFQCCGLDQGYIEWGDNIPESCKCTEKSTNTCVAAPKNSDLVMIFSKPCLPYIIDYAMSYLQIFSGSILGYTVLWVLSVVLCIVILCQLNAKEETPTVVYSKEAKAGNYTSLTETLN